MSTVKPGMRSACDIGRSSDTFRRACARVYEDGVLELIAGDLGWIVTHAERYVRITEFEGDVMHLPTKSLMNSALGLSVPKVCLVPSVQSKIDSLWAVLYPYFRDVEDLSCGQVYLTFLVDDDTLPYCMFKLVRSRGGVSLRVRGRSGDMGTDMPCLELRLVQKTDEY